MPSRRARIARVPILKHGDTLIVNIQATLDDAELEELRAELAIQVGAVRARKVVVDVSAVDVLDSFSTRTLLGVARVTSLRGARTVIVGIQPDVAFAMVQLGLTLDGVDTALDLEEGIALLALSREASSARG